MITKKYYLITFLFLLSVNSFAQTAYFIDGFHGGIWGHYPVGYTSFIVDQLKKHPDWNINLEIEPETWDRVEVKDPQAYKEFKNLFADQPSSGRVEYVNPAYGQPYLYNISGESIIRQFSYGMKKVKSHFPSVSFKTYSSEEPCFTSALPQILRSFGFKYASLKNPNTCWGGYTRAYGGELVNWIGPDGTKITAVPRYQIESLKPGSTWETIGNGTSKEYIQEAFDYGIQHPVGMCLQDAGWRFGPWLKGDFYKPTVYTTWSNYFENITSPRNAADWKFSQEDILTSLVWGSQVLQRIAQQVRLAENNLVQTEKIALINKLDGKGSYPGTAIDTAWRSLLLAQHHDCWIVPYNGKKGDTWADKVRIWTDEANDICDSIKISNLEPHTVEDRVFIKVYNTLGHARTEWVKAVLPQGYNASEIIITDENDKELPSQRLLSDNAVIFKAAVPAFGYTVYKLQKGISKIKTKEANAVIQPDGDCVLETDLYKIYIDKQHGGAIKSLIAKSVDNKDFVDKDSERRFNELRGNFYKKGGFLSSAQHPAVISILEKGPYRVSVKIEGIIAGSPFSQIITLTQGQERIDCDLKIDWKTNEGIGEFEETHHQSTALHKAFYNDQYKLLTLFPLSLKDQKVYKDAPFDVTESGLENTFFSRWDSIKNNIMLHWVDVVSGDKKYGMALFTDHTTSYAHGENHPLGLTAQYSGYGLWGRNYAVDTSTHIRYALLPHKGNWQDAHLNSENEKINEPLYAYLTDSKPLDFKRSYIELTHPDWVLSSCTFDKENLYIRIFNAGGKASSGGIKLDFDRDTASWVNLDGSIKDEADLEKISGSGYETSADMRPFEFKTLKVPAKE